MSVEGATRAKCRRRHPLQIGEKPSSSQGVIDWQKVQGAMGIYKGVLTSCNPTQFLDVEPFLLILACV